VFLFAGFSRLKLALAETAIPATTIQQDIVFKAVLNGSEDSKPLSNPGSIKTLNLADFYGVDGMGRRPKQ
jgi:hypothetical protein